MVSSVLKSEWTDGRLSSSIQCMVVITELITNTPKILHTNFSTTGGKGDTAGITTVANKYLIQYKFLVSVNIDYFLISLDNPNRVT